jgi:hypothetical protein
MTTNSQMPASPSLRVLGAYCIEACESAFDVAENEVRCTGLDLYVDALVRERQLNILIVFDDDVSQTGDGRFEETGNGIEPVSPHGLRAGFVTTAYRNGVPDEEIMGHTRHRSLTTMRGYVRRAKLSHASPAGKVGL